MKPYRSFKITKVKDNEKENISNPIAVETVHHLYLNSERIRTFACSPHDRDALSIGYLFLMGYIETLEELESYTLTEHEFHGQLSPLAAGRLRERLKKETTTGEQENPPLQPFGTHQSPMPMKITVCWEDIVKACRALSISAEIFKQTGGTHVAGMFDINGNLIALAEDVGHHNVIDKIIGKIRLLRIPTSKLFMAFSGGFSQSMVLKMACLGTELLAGLSSPLSTGIQAADQLGITLVGFISNTQLNIYTCEARVIIPNT